MLGLFQIIAHMRSLSGDKKGNKRKSDNSITYALITSYPKDSDLSAGLLKTHDIYQFNW